MSLRSYFLVLFSAIVIVNGSFAEEKARVVISSGNITGVYYPTAGAICREINTKDDSITCLVRASNGSFQALSELREGNSNMAIVQSDVANDAYLSTGLMDKEEKFTELRAIAALYDDIFTIIVREDSDIKTTNDIKGRKISYGNSGSGTFSMFNALMKIKDWQLSDFTQVLAVSPSDQPEALCSKEIDVVLFSAAHPNGTIKEIFNNCDARIIALSQSEINKLIENNSSYKHALIPAKLYRNNPEITSISSKATLLTTTRMTNNMAYNITKQMNVNIKELHKMHPVLNHLKASELPLIEGNIPLHVGAKKYYIEAGLLEE